MIISFLSNLFTFNRIQRAKGKINRAVSSFKKAHAGIEKANAILTKSIELHEQKRELLHEELKTTAAHVTAARLEINGNKSLQNKLKSFIPNE